MRIALYGNVANSLYVLAKCLREQTDMDVHLFVGENDVFTMLPESDDPSIVNASPGWIHRGVFNRGLARLLPSRSALVRELSAYDFVLVSYNGPAFAQFCGRPWAFYSAGSDLTAMPFPWKMRRLYPRLRQKLLMASIGFWQRRGIRRADVIWTQGFAPFQLALSDLRVEPQRIKDVYLPILVDDELLAAGQLRSIADPIAAEIRERSDFVVFHPSRLVIDDSPARRRTGEWKGNDRLIAGFAKFVRSGVADRPVLVMPDRTTSLNMAEAKQLVRKLGIEEFVHWAQPPSPEGFPRYQLYEWYRCADVVADDFGVGWFGGVVVEGLSFRKPVVSYVDEAVMSTMYPTHPLISVREPAGIASALRDLHADPTKRAELGEAGRRWIEEHHSYDAVAERYAASVHEAIRDLG